MSQPIDRAHVEVVPDIDKFLTQVQKDLDKAFKNAAKDIEKSVGKIEKDFDRLGNDITGTLRRAGQDGGRRFADGIRGERNRVRGALTSLFAGFVLGPEIQLILRQIRSNILLAIAGLGAAAGQALGQALIPIAASFAGTLAFLPGIIAGVVGSFAVLKAATAGVGDALKHAGEKDATAFNEALKKLAPTAQAFARAVRAMRLELRPVQQAMQNAFFAGIDTNISLISDRIAALRPLLVQVAGAFNGVFRDVTRLFGGIQGLSAASGVLTGIRDFVNAIRPGLLALTTAFIRLAGNAGAFGRQFGTVINRLLTQFAAFLEGINLREVIQNVSAAIQTFLPVLRVLGVVFNVIGTVADAFRPALSALGPAFTALGKIIADIAIAMGPGFAALIKGLATGLKGLAPAAAPFGAALGAIGKALGPIVAALGPQLANIIIVIATAVQGLLTLLQPFIVIITKVAGTFAKALTPVLTKLASAAMPLIAKAAKQILAAFTPMIPVITRIATQVATQLLPGLLKLGLAFLKQVLPQMVKFAEIVGPALVTFLEELEPHIPLIVRAILDMVKAWLQINAVMAPLIPLIARIIVLLLRLTVGGINVVIGAARLFGRVMGGFVRASLAVARGAINGTIAVVRTATRIFNTLRSTVLRAIRGAISVIRRLPGQIRSAFSNARSLLVNTGRNIIRGLISGIKNMARSAANAAINVVKGAISSARRALGIGSPSKVAAQEIGVPVGQGIELGFDKVKSDVANALAGLALPRDILSSSVAPDTVAPSGSTDVDLRELVEAFARVLNGMEWRFVDVDKVVSRATGRRADVMRRA